MSKNEIDEFQQFDLGEQAAAYATATHTSEPPSTDASFWLKFFHKSADDADDLAEALGKRRASDVAAGTPCVPVKGSYRDGTNASYMVLKSEFYNATLENGMPAATAFGGKKMPGGVPGAVGIVLVIGEDYVAPALCQVAKWTKIQVLARPVEKHQEVATAPGTLKKPGMDKVPAHLRVVSEFRLVPKPGKPENNIPPYAQVKSVSRAIKPEEFAKVGAFFTTGAPGLAECEEIYAKKIEELRGLSA